MISGLGMVCFWCSSRARSNSRAYATTTKNNRQPCSTLHLVFQRTVVFFPAVTIVFRGGCLASLENFSVVLLDYGL